MGQDIRRHATTLSLSETHDHEIRGHAGKRGASRPCPNGHDVTTHTIITSQIGWIDQRGYVYPNGYTGKFAGSLTPLLVQKDCD